MKKNLQTRQKRTEVVWYEFGVLGRSDDLVDGVDHTHATVRVGEVAEEAGFGVLQAACTYQFHLHEERGSAHAGCRDRDNENRYEEEKEKDRVIESENTCVIEGRRE